MMREVVVPLAVPGAMLVGLLPALALVALVRRRRMRDARRAPVTDVLLRLPGEGALMEAGRLDETIGERFVLAITVGPVLLAGWALLNLDLQTLRFGALEGFFLVAALAIGSWAGWSALKLSATRRRYLEGRVGERATAQALMPLISRGCAVYHDVPATTFNLDHVVVGPDRVFLVESKSRRKPPGRGSASATARSDGRAIRFPDGRNTAMLEQARAEARWLADYLYRKTGERVPVEPVLALPGW